GGETLGSPPGPGGAGGTGGGTGVGALAPSSAARSRRATGASTVLDADLTNSPISLSFASTVLLSTPSSFASSCTRALPATALLTPRPARQTRSDLTRPLEAWSFLGLHRVLMSVVLPCWSGWGSARPPSAVPVDANVLTASLSSPVSRTPVTRNARPKA